MGEKEIFETSTREDLESSGSSFSTIDPVAEKKLVRKCDIRVVPLLFLLYVLAYLDRINIGNAKIEGMPQELKMKGNDYNVALLVFFIPYILLEVPSNLILKNLDPPKWLSGMMFICGILAMCMGFVKTKQQLIAMRILLGVFESGFYPGCLYLMSMYYKRDELLKRYTAFYCSTHIAGSFGGLLAFGFADLKEKGGLSAWQWIFIGEGLITVVTSVVAFFFIAPWPQDAKWLTAEEKDLVFRRNEEGVRAAKMNRMSLRIFGRVARDWKIWCGVGMYMGVCTTGYSQSFFVPTFLSEFGYSPSEAQLHTIPLFAVSLLLSLFIAWLSDRQKHRYGFLIFGILVSTIGYSILLNQEHLSRSVKYMALFFLLSGSYTVLPIAMCWMNNSMGGHYKRGAAMAFQIGFGNIGGIIGSNIYQSKDSPRYRSGFGAGLGMLWFCGFCATILFFGLRRENKKRDQGLRDDRLKLSKEEQEVLGDDHPHFRYIL